MAGDWIKMRVDLATDPAVIGIAAALDCPENEVVGMLHRFWSWADAQSRDGHAAGVTKKWIDRYVQRDGFSELLEKNHWLIVSDEGIEIPNFGRHNGAPAKGRALAKDRQKIQREKTSREPSRSERDESVTREEKRREEKNQGIPPCIPPEEKPAKAPTRKTKIPEPFNLTSEMRKWAAEHAPAIDLIAHTANFVDYWRSEGKTKVSWEATWRMWMRREQNNLNNRYTQRGGMGQGRNPQQEAHDHNMAVLRQIEEQERLRMAGENGQQFLEPGGDLLTLDGEVLHAGS